MNEKDYSAQKKHIRTHYARFPLDLRPEVLEEFTPPGHRCEAVRTLDFVTGEPSILRVLD